MCDERQERTTRPYPDGEPIGYSNVGGYAGEAAGPSAPHEDRLKQAIDTFAGARSRKGIGIKSDRMPLREQVRNREHELSKRVLHLQHELAEAQRQKRAMIRLAQLFDANPQLLEILGLLQESGMGVTFPSLLRL